MGGRFKREGTYAYLWLMHIDVWQKPTQYCKAIVLQLKTKQNKTLSAYLRNPWYLVIDFQSPSREEIHRLLITVQQGGIDRMFVLCDLRPVTQSFT